MTGQDRIDMGFGPGARLATGVAAVAMTLAALGVAVAQQPSTQPAQQPQPVETPPPVETLPANRPGFLDVFGRWVSESMTSMKSGVDKTGETIGSIGTQATGAARGAADAASGVATGAVEAARGASGAALGAADSVVRLGGTRFVNGRERCVLASNGAPDCAGAAVSLCKGNGYGTGSSVDMQSAEKCSAAAYLSGRRDGACGTEYYVTRAMCQ